MVYRPAITPGFRVTLRAGTRHHSMHVAAGRVTECGTPVRGDVRDNKLVRPSAAAGLKLARAARSDLAKRLGIPETRIVIDVYRPTTWPDARLGCAAPAGDAAPPPQPTRGFVIELTAGGNTYEYHSDLARVVACAPPA